MNSEEYHKHVLDPVAFGRVIGHLEAIRSEVKELRERTVYRLDDMELRVEVLEKLGEAHKVPKLADKLADKLVWGGLGALGIFVLKSAGVF